MPRLLSDGLTRVAHYHMEQNKDKEHPVATFMACLQRVYLHENTIVNATEKPPTTHSNDRHRRVDSVTQWHIPQTWELPVSAVWEVKKPNATPSEIETCEGQVFDACERSLAGRTHGKCFGFSGFGSFWRVFLLEKPGNKYTCLTGEGDSTREFYVDISDDSDGSEAIMFDSCLRDLREYMGFSRNGIRPDVNSLYPPPPANTATLCWFFDMKRSGWKYERNNLRFVKFDNVNNAWKTVAYQAPIGLA